MLFGRKASQTAKQQEKASRQNVLSPDQFQFRNLRHWSDLQDEDHAKLRYGFIKIVDTVPTYVRESQDQVTEGNLADLRRYSLAVGICHRAHFQYKVFRFNCLSLLEGFEFDEEGTLSFADRTLSDVYTEINAIWQNIIASGRKFLLWLEDDLRERFGPGSPEFNEWKEAYEATSDISLVSDFCFRDPALVERDFLFLNMSHVDLENSRTGFAVGMDQNFMDYDLGEGLRKKIADILRDRQERGLSPQLTVVDLVSTFQAQVALLYADYLMIMMRDAERFSGLVSQLFDDRSLNCVILDPGEDAASDAVKLVYRIPNTPMTEHYTGIADRIYKKYGLR